MANETKITDIVGKEAIEQLKNLDDKLVNTQKIYVELITTIGKGISFNPTNLTELNKKTDDYRSNVEKLKKAINDINAINDKYNKTIDNIIEGNKRASNSALKLVDSQEKYTSSIQKETLEIQNNNQTKQQEIIISGQLKSLIDQTLGIRSENIQRVAEERTVLSQLSKEKSTLNKLEKNGVISTKEAVEKRKEIISSELLHRNSLRELLNVLTNETKLVISSKDSYQEQSLQLERLRMAYRMLTSDMANSPLGNELNANISILDKSLKGIDSKLGQYGRSVGNYKSHWDGLGNSVAQLTREAPAFAVSLNTGFLAISNNIPILADEINKVIKLNKELRAQGVKTVPVIKQIAKAFFSWQTLLSVGITLLTIYGDEIVNWGKKIFSASEYLNGAKKAQEDLNSSTGKFSKELKNSSSTYAENVVTIKRLQEEWNILGDNLDKKKQFVINNASEFKRLNISVTDVNDAENLLVTNTDSFIKALELRAKATAGEKLAQEKYAEAIMKRVEAENLRKKADEKEKEKDGLQLGKNMKVYAPAGLPVYSNMGKPAEGIESEVKALNRMAKAREEEAKSLESAGKAYLDYAASSTEASREVLKNAGMEEDANEEARKKSEEEAKRRKRLEMEAERNLQESKIKLMDEGYEKERLSLEQSYQKRIDEVKTKGIRVNEQIKAIEMERAKALYDFDEEFQHKRMISDVQNRIDIVEKGSLEELDARLDMLNLQREEELKEAEKTGQDKVLIETKYNKIIENEFEKFGKNQLNEQLSQNELLNNEREIALNNELAMLKQNYSQGIIDKKEYEQKKADIEYKFAVESLKNELKLLEENLNLFSGQERLDMEKRISELRLKLSEKTTDKIINDAEKELEARRRIEELKKQLVKEAADAISSIGNSIFERQINNIDKEIEANKEEYDRKIENIESLAEKDVITAEEAEARKRSAIALSEAKNKELEKKKADLQTKQAKFQKAIDISKTIASTASAIMTAFKDLGPISGAIAAALIGSIGALQLATIVAQPIPKYAKGTDFHPGGLAIVGDGGKNEVIISGNKAYITPDIPTLLELPKGVEVIPDIRKSNLMDRFVDNTYWLSHNGKGEPVNIVNNVDLSPIIESNKKIEKSIVMLAKSYNKGNSLAMMEVYKTRIMN